MFPRDTKFCTKCPVILKLGNGENTYSVTFKNETYDVDDKTKIYPIICDIMKNQIDQNEITTEEITINIVEPHLPVFEYYDLPGIVSYPLENNKKTIDICKSYIDKKNTIILCVVPATVTRLTTCQSVALIKELKMESDTILALTMTDRLQQDNIGELLIDRLTNSSDELKNLNFSGCIAVINRVHNDICNLSENDKNEEKWFNNNIISNIPTEMHEELALIKKNIGIANMIYRIDELYNNYIIKEWKPRVSQMIDEKIHTINKSINLLGIPIDQMTDSYKDNIISYIYDNISTNTNMRPHLCTDMCNNNNCINYLDTHTISYHIIDTLAKLDLRAYYLHLWENDFRVRISIFFKKKPFRN